VTLPSPNSVRTVAVVILIGLGLIHFLTLPDRFEIAGYLGLALILAIGRAAAGAFGRLFQDPADDQGGVWWYALAQGLLNSLASGVLSVCRLGGMTQVTEPAAPAAAAPARRTGPGLLPYGFAVVFGAVYTAYSLLRHARLGSAAFDLGIFDQAVRAYSRLKAPIVPLKGPGYNLLGDHFHPVLAVLAPFYRLWPDARLLLVAQALLLAASIVPIGRLAVTRLGRAAGSAVVVAYGLSFGLQGMLGFDFHEVAFAVPLTACAMVALAEERWRAAALWTLPLLLVKEDMGLTVAAIGAYLIFRRQRRLGAALVAAGAVVLVLAMFVVIPHFSPNRTYRYFGQLDSSQGSALFSHPDKLLLPLTLLAITGFAALRSPLLVVALPVVAYRLDSANPHYWSVTTVHYNAMLMPILFVALMDALPRLPRPYARIAPAGVLVVALALLPQFSLWHLARPGYYRMPAHVTAARQVLAEIPSGSTVAATDYLAPQLTDRCTVILFPDLYRRGADWIVVDTTGPAGVHATPAQRLAAVRALPGQGYRQVAAADGVLLFHRAT
jgi:uncharacterized membrane protein